jgi:NAD(P)-dependent dehydrogenase (short-subunit alcohol dehydrogenase family)
MRPSDAIDSLLDQLVVPGFSSIGYRLRRRWWPADVPPGALSGRDVAVTGANSGLGKAAAAGAAALGARVHMLVRSPARGEDARAEIIRQLPSAVLDVRACDVSDPDSVRSAAEALLADVPRLHGLVHNAGVMPPQRTETAAGHELTLATHVLGPHMLTALLRPSLVEDGDARVVFVSSGGMYTQPLRTDDPEYEQGEYAPTRAYARTKRMQVVLAERWARELAADGVAVHSMHPGWADTPGVIDSLPRFAKLAAPILRSAEQGADTVVWLLGSPEAGPAAGRGLFWHDRRPRPTTRLPRTSACAQQVEELWRMCVEVTGLP